MHIHYVCTGNEIRSFWAELVTKKYARMNGIDLTASSSGINARWQNGIYEIIQRANPKRLVEGPLDIAGYSSNIKIPRHFPKRTTPNRLWKADHIICMTHEHQKFIENLGFESFLFNYIAFGEKEDLMDAFEYQDSIGRELEGYEIGHIDSVITENIYEGVPKLYQNLVRLGENKGKL